MLMADLTEAISNVETMGGDLLTDVLAPSEIRAIADALIASGLVGSARSDATSQPGQAPWMAMVPSYMHDCFAS